MVVAALAMVALVLFMALALDVGFIWSSRTQNQNVSDSAAVAAAQSMIVPKDPANPTVNFKFDKTGAIAEGKKFANLNSTVANPSAQVNDDPATGDFTFGTWNTTTHTLDPADETNVDAITGVRANIRMDGTTNQRSPGLLSRIFQKSEDGSRPYMAGFEVNNTSVAYLGFVSGFNDIFDWPVAIDSSKLTKDPNGCGSDFCNIASSKPYKACPLVPAQDDSKEVVCLEFSNTADQNACWTNYSTNTNSSGSKDIVKNGGYHGNVDVGDKYDVSNGDESDAVKEMYDKFYGTGGKKASKGVGTNVYGPDPNIDSWVIQLPVIEPQNVVHCAGGTMAKVIGGVCFEVREIDAPGGGGGGDRLIKGRFLCPNSPNQKVRDLYRDNCVIPGNNQPGGCNYGMRVQRVVLVQ